MRLILSPSHDSFPKPALTMARCVAAALMAIALGAGAVSAGTSHRTSDARCNGEMECNLHLAADEERPFLWQGKVVGDPAADIPDKMRNLLEGPVRKYPSLASCVSNPEVIPQDLGQAKLKWSEFRSQYEAEVCLFRLFDRLGNIDMISAWLAKLGFTEFRLREGGDAFWRFLLGNKTGIEFEASWSIRERGPIYGGFFNKLKQEAFTAYFTVTGLTDKSGKLVWVFIQGHSKLEK